LNGSEFLASRWSVRSGEEDPEEALLGNVALARNVLEACRRHCPGARILFQSSSEVYGLGPSGRGAEVARGEDDPLLPLSTTGASMACGEILARQYVLGHGLHIVVARLFNTVGPHLEFTQPLWDGSPLPGTLLLHYEQGFGAMTFTLTTDGGRTMPVVMDKWGLNTLYGLGSWGFVFDVGNMEGRSYNGLGFQWVQHIEPRKSIMQREDAYLGSYSLVLKHQATHAIIRGGVMPIVSR